MNCLQKIARCNKCILVILFVMSIIAGCSSTNDKIQQSADFINRKIPTMIEDDTTEIGTTISICTDAGLNSIAAAFCEKSSIQLSGEKIKDGYNFSCELFYPDVKEIKQKIVTSDTFNDEYNSLKEAKASEEELLSCIHNYVLNIILDTKCPMLSENFSETAETLETAKSEIVINVDSILSAKLRELLTTTFYDESKMLKEGKAVSGVFNVDKVKWYSDFFDFPIVYKKNKLLLSNFDVKYNDAAIEELKSIDECNSNLCCNASEDIILLRYDVTNLSAKACIYSNSFHLGNESGDLFELQGVNAIGLTEKVKIKQGKTKTIQTILVGPKESIFYLFSENLIGVRGWLLHGNINNFTQ